MSERKIEKLIKKDLDSDNIDGLEDFFVPWEAFSNEMKKLSEFKVYISKRIDNNFEAIQSIKDNDFKKFNQNFTNIESNMKTFETECLQNKNNIKNIQQELQEMKLSLDHNDEKINNLQLTLFTNGKAIKSKIETNERNIGEVKIDVENNQKIFDNFEQEFAKEWETAKKEVKKLKQISQEIRKDVVDLSFDVEEHTQTVLKAVELIDEEINETVDKWKKEFKLVKDSSQRNQKDVVEFKSEIAKVKIDTENNQKVFDSFEQQWRKEKKELHDNIIKNDKEIKILQNSINKFIEQEFLSKKELEEKISNYTPKLVFSADVNEKSNIIEIPNYDNTKWNEFSVIYEILLVGKKQKAHGSLRRAPNIDPTINSAIVIRDIDSEYAVNLVFEPQVSPYLKAYISLWSFATKKKKDIIKLYHYSWSNN